MEARHVSWQVLLGWDPEPGAARRALDRHCSTCLPCQAEGARQRGLQRRLVELRTEVTAAPVGLLVAVLDGIDRADGAGAGSARRALTGAAATAAVLIALVGWRRLRHA